MEIKAADVKALRDRTGAGMMAITGIECSLAISMIFFANNSVPFANSCGDSIFCASYLIAQAMCVGFETTKSESGTESIIFCCNIC